MATKVVEKQEYKNNAERLAALKRAAKATNTKLGMECVTMASDIEEAKRAATGVKEIDDFIGGGIPHGNLTVVWGAQSSGKTTIGLCLARKAQKEGKLVAWIALEPFPRERAIQFGINLDEMPVIQCPQAEQSLDIIIEYARNKYVDLFILDSIHSLAPKGMQENSKGEKSLADDTMALLARKLSEFFKIAIDPIKRSEMALMFIGQTRKGLGSFVVLDQLTGGNALLHNSRLTIHVRRGAKDDSPVRKFKNAEGKTETEIIGFPCVLKLDKVQVSGAKTEQSVINIPFYYETGFDLPNEVKKEIDAEEAEIKAQEEPKIEKTDVDKAEVPSEASSPTVEVATQVKRRGRPSKKA
jgi:RecA/RadA recombinase